MLWLRPLRAEDESDREASVPPLLSPRSAAALNGAKIKPDQSGRSAQQAQQGAQQGRSEGMDLDAGDDLLDAGGAATPCDSDALGPVPPLLRPAAPGAMDSPFSAGGLLRSSPGAAGPGPAGPIYAGKPLVPPSVELAALGGLVGGGGSAAVRGAAAAASAPPGVPTPGGLAELGAEEAGAAGVGGGSAASEHAMSLAGGVLDGIALPPPADPASGLLALGHSRCAWAGQRRACMQGFASQRCTRLPAGSKRGLQGRRGQTAAE